MALFLGLNALFLSGCSYGDIFRATVSKSEKGTIASSIQSLTVDNQFGPVVVTGVDSDFGWDWNLKCQATSEAKAKEHADKCRMEVREEGSTLHLVLSHPNVSGFNPPSITSELHIRVPKTIRLEAKNSFGPIEITEITGSPMKVHNQNGSIALKSIPGELDAATSFDFLTAQNIGGAHLRNQNGSIKVDQASGDLVAHTSFDSLSVRNVKGTVSLENQNGRIDANDVAGIVKAHTSFDRIHLENTGPATLSNQNGEIEASQVKGDLIAKTSFTRLSAINIQGRAELSNQNGEITAKQISGDIKARTSFARMELSGQGSTIDAHNQNGAIEINATSTQTTKINAETSFDSIQVRLPEKANPLITAEASFGKIQSDFPVIMKGTLSVEKENSDPASPKVRLKTQNGDIRINNSDSR